MTAPLGYWVLATLFCGIPYHTYPIRNWEPTKKLADDWVWVYTAEPGWFWQLELATKCIYLDVKVVSETRP